MVDHIIEFEEYGMTIDLNDFNKLSDRELKECKEIIERIKRKVNG